MRKKAGLVVLFAVIFVAILFSRKVSTLVDNKDVTGEETVVFLDPGHGGEDPGKVGIGEVLEKDLNLKISKKLKSLLEDQGITVYMTRENDNVPDSKNEDLQERVKSINSENPSVAVCIHQNSYTDPDIKGAQVFYHTKTEEAKEIASLVQEELRVLDPDNEREIKENDTYYMLKYVEAPTIIVECGFLTNPEETEKLLQEEYQDQLAQSICDGLLKWVEK